jgi:hypothetical protein
MVADLFRRECALVQRLDFGGAESIVQTKAEIGSTPFRPGDTRGFAHHGRAALAKLLENFVV